MVSDLELERQSELQILYLKNMAKIKWRVKAVTDILSNSRSTTFRITNIEFCVLQIRKILELIVLSALVSDADVYRNALGGIEKMWNARLIIRDIERIHPRFYPEPITIVPKAGSDGLDAWIPKEEPYLTKSMFISVYEKCGRYLHEPTPFKTEEEIDDSYGEAEAKVPEWIGLIIALLSTHVVHLYNQKTLFYVSMGAEGKLPSGNIFNQIIQ